MAIVKTTECKLELKAARRPAAQLNSRGATVQHTDDAALLYTVGGSKVVLRQGDDRIELDAAQLADLQAHTVDILADLAK